MTTPLTGPATPPVATNADDESQYPHGFKLFLVTIALLSAMFLVSLDATILATAIPNITDHFHSLNDVGWYGGSYLFAVGALQLLYGKLYTIYRIKSVFLVAVALFELGSLVAGVAPTSDALIIGRTISGAGAAGILAGAIIIIGTSVPLRQRPIFTGVLSAVHGISSVIGPILGGVFTDHITWRLCFLINLPFGVITIVFLHFCLPQRPPKQLALPWNEQIKQFDLPGTFCIVPSIISLLLALQWGGSVYPFNDGRIIALFVLAGVFAIAFAGVEIWQGDNATLPGRIVKNKNILGGVWFGVFISGAILIFTYYLPIWFQAIQGVSATQSGIRTLPTVLGLVLFSIIGGGAATALGQYVPLLIISSIVASIGAGLLSTLKVDSTIGYWFGYQVLMAAGVGLGAQNVMLVGQVAVPHADMAMAISVMSFSQTLSSSIFLAVAQAVFQNSLVSTLRAKAPEIDPRDVINGGVTAIRRLVTAEQLPGVLQAYNSAIMQTIYIAVAASGLSIAGTFVMDWLSLKTEAETEKEESPPTTTNKNATADGASAKSES